MLYKNLSEEARYGIIIVASVFLLLLAMFLLNLFLGEDAKKDFVEKEKERAVIIKQAKQGDAPKNIESEKVVSTIREALKHANYSTAYIEINNVPKDSPEYQQLSKMIAEETQRRKAPGVKKETGASPSAPLRYFDESTPRDKNTDAVYVYFVDIRGVLWPRFCIQNAAKKPLGITGFTITADKKNITLNAPDIKFENTENGIAEWHDVPLDKPSYDAVQAMLNAKKATLTIVGSNGKATRDVTEAEIKGMRRVLDGYTALGGSLSYLQQPKTSIPAQKNANAPK